MMSIPGVRRVCARACDQAASGEQLRNVHGSAREQQMNPGRLAAAPARRPLLIALKVLLIVRPHPAFRTLQSQIIGPRTAQVLEYNPSSPVHTGLEVRDGVEVRSPDPAEQRLGPKNPVPKPSSCIAFRLAANTIMSYHRAPRYSLLREFLTMVERLHLALHPQPRPNLGLL
ncbi:hypothetical protein B0H17DRAFT_69830 [Mycena rosella]|uniref:Uncharacterized protein n=1 Tax=Mycena rosella TaxID=1033263 RepID=A0AAD7G9G1_MYCRO|nr:hypothetical protein B0H17DRAFT_69830 [Mycena rosella]